MAEKVAAILTIKNPGELSVSGKRSILAWLKRQERYFSRNSHKMAKQFRARYLYQEEEDASTQGNK